MTKGELRRARRAEMAEGRRLEGELALPGDRSTVRDDGFSEGARGRAALQRWADWYDQLNGAPESEDDR